MRKIIILSLLMLLVSILTSCFSTPTYNIDYYTSNIINESTYLKSDIMVDVIPKDITQYGYDGFIIKVSNNSKTPITVNFEKSSISYLYATHIPFITGMKYVDAGAIPVPKTLPSDITTIFELYSPEQPYTLTTSGAWDMQPIYISDNSPITILLCIDINDEHYYWKTSITYNLPNIDNK